MKDRILIAVDDLDRHALQKIKAAVSGWATVESIAQQTGEIEYRAALRGCTACIGWPDAAWLPESGVRLLQTGSSGWESYRDRGLERIEGFSLCTAKGIYTIGVAEHAIAMMFSLVRRIPVHVHDKDRKQFRRHLPYAPEIAGSVACVIGLGDIGTAVARLCRGLDMSVIAVTRRPVATNRNIDRVFPLSAIAEALGLADHIFLCLPGTPENAVLIGRPQLECCKKSAFLYNISRGSVLDETSLHALIRDGALAGAGLDVTTVEPLPLDSPLWQLGDHVLITGHSAGLSQGHASRFLQLVIRNLKNFHEQRPLINKVI